MKIPLPIRTILRPSITSMIAVLMSFGAWIFPDFDGLNKGFDRPEQLTLTSVVILACWYLLIFVCFTLGQKIGELRIFTKVDARSNLFSMESNVVYYWFTFLSAIGICSMLSMIFHYLSLREAILSISLGQTNALKNSIYDNGDYSVGLVSLRYLILYPSSLALYRIIRLRSFSLVNIFNVFMLALFVFLSSRLMLIAALLTTAFLLAFGRHSIKISIPKLAISAAFIFLLLSVLNISRNASFYEKSNESFGMAGLSEIFSYLGSPFQAEIGSASITERLVAGDSYRNYVDIRETLNTNSAFVLLHEQMGYVCWVYIALVCLFMGFVFEVLLSMGKTIFLLPAGAILYGSAELWRLDLYQQGAFIIWFVFGIGLPVFLIFLEHLRCSMGRLWRMPVKS
jgi:hypothetical protein